MTSSDPVLDSGISQQGHLLPTYLPMTEDMLEELWFNIQGQMGPSLGPLSLWSCTPSGESPVVTEGILERLLPKARWVPGLEFSLSAALRPS